MSQIVVELERCKQAWEVAYKLLGEFERKWIIPIMEKHGLEFSWRDDMFEPLFIAREDEGELARFLVHSKEGRKFFGHIVVMKDGAIIIKDFEEKIVETVHSHSSKDV